MWRLLAIAILVAAVSACSGPTPTADGGRKDGGSGGADGGASEFFNVFTLDPDGGEPTYLAMAVDPMRERVGIAYYAALGTQSQNGHQDYALRYVEWKQGVVSPIETIRGIPDGGDRGPVQRTVGLSVAFHPTSGEPSVAFLGGASGFRPGDTIYWFQSDAVVANRNAGTWTQVTAAQNGGDTTCGNPVSDTGFLVGVWPAIAFNSTGTLFFAWRDGHNGQFEMQDWAGSDVELASGPPAGPFTRTCVKQGGNDKFAWGARLQLSMVNEQPALIYDRAFSGADTQGQDVTFQKRLANGTWTAPIVVFGFTNTQTGGSLAYEATEGFGVAAVDRAQNQLFYKKSVDGLSWTSADAVFGRGTGGWYPSLAMDPVNHEPGIAFYVCSDRNSVNEGSCPEAEDQLLVTQRIVNEWRETPVDAAGGIHNRLAYFGSGKRVVAYRDPRSGSVKLAVEK